MIIIIETVDNKLAFRGNINNKYWIIDIIDYDINKVKKLFSDIYGKNVFWEGITVIPDKTFSEEKLIYDFINPLVFFSVCKSFNEQEIMFYIENYDIIEKLINDWELNNNNYKYNTATIEKIKKKHNLFVIKSIIE